MPTEALFRQLQRRQLQLRDPEQAGREVRIEFEGQALNVPADVSLAAALLAHSVGHTRNSAINGRPGAPYCMMGVCFECLVEVDGQANCQACLIQVEEGMSVRRQRGARDLMIDHEQDEEAVDE